MNMNDKTEEEKNMYMKIKTSVRQPIKRIWENQVRGVVIFRREGV